jgi:hypothetical protein
LPERVLLILVELLKKYSAQVSPQYGFFGSIVQNQVLCTEETSSRIRPTAYPENWVIFTVRPSGNTARISRSAPTAWR